MPKDAQTFPGRSQREILEPLKFVFFLWILLDCKPNISRSFVLASAALIYETQGTYGRCVPNPTPNMNSMSSISNLKKERRFLTPTKIVSFLILKELRTYWSSCDKAVEGILEPSC